VREQAPDLVDRVIAPDQTRQLNRQTHVHLRSPPHGRVESFYSSSTRARRPGNSHDVRPPAAP
jgi:hypothetical protein